MEKVTVAEFMDNVNVIVTGLCSWVDMDDDSKEVQEPLGEKPTSD